MNCLTLAIRLLVNALSSCLTVSISDSKHVRNLSVLSIQLLSWEVWRDAWLVLIELGRRFSDEEATVVFLLHWLRLVTRLLVLLDVLAIFLHPTIGKSRIVLAHVSFDWLLLQKLITPYVYLFDHIYLLKELLYVVLVFLATINGYYRVERLLNFDHLVIDRYSPGLCLKLLIIWDALHCLWLC